MENLENDGIYCEIIVYFDGLVVVPLTMEPKQLIEYEESQYKEEHTYRSWRNSVDSLLGLPPSKGLWIWEGVQKFEGYPNFHNYEGKFRSLTSIELVNFNAGT